jgi:uncharacterized protein YndB with AHSA1/START domain
MISSTSHQKLVLRRKLSAPPATVFDVWTTPDHIKKWFAPSDDYTNPFVEVDPREGGAYRIAFQSLDGELAVVGGSYVTVQPPKKLVFTWRWESPHEFESHETLVTVDIVESDGGAELVLTHERFPAGPMREKHEFGWSGALDRLVKVVV